MRFSRGPAHGNVSSVHTRLKVKKDMNQRKEELDVTFIASHLFLLDLSLIPIVPGHNKLQIPSADKTCYYPQQVKSGKFKYFFLQLMKLLPCSWITSPVDTPRQPRRSRKACGIKVSYSDVIGRSVLR